MKSWIRDSRTRLAGGVALWALLCGAPVHAQQTEPATIPTSLHGTYELTFQSTHNDSPVAGGTPVTMVLAPGGTLCIADYMLYSPVLKNGDPSEAYWTESSLDLQLAVSHLQDGFSQASLVSMDGTVYGQFSGNKVSNNTTCSVLGSTPPDMERVSEIVELAETLYSDYFPEDGEASGFQVTDGFVYRFYDGSNTYIGIKNGTVYVSGGVFGEGLTTIGGIGETLSQLQSEQGGSGSSLPEGDFDLNVEGTLTTTVEGQTFSQNFTSTFNNVAAPGSGDLDLLEERLRAAMDQASEDLDAATIYDVEISDVSFASNRVFYRAQFSAEVTADGVTATGTYDLAYEYTRN